MAWAKVFKTMQSKVSNSLSWRLWIAYLAAMSAIFGISAVAVFSVFHTSLQRDRNEHLQTLAQAAVPSLDRIKNKGTESLQKDLPWRSLFKKAQSLEWFDADGKLLARKGNDFPEFPLLKNSVPVRIHEGSPLIQKDENLTSVSIAVYADSEDRKTLNLEGYIRASESNQALASRLHQLQLGLKIGGITALILSSIAGGVLTIVVIRPVKKSYQHLRQFTADASHEISNPLTAIITTVQLMESHSDELPPDFVRKIATISSASDQIKRLVEDLRFLSQTDSHTHPSQLEYPTIPLDEILEDIADNFETQAYNKELGFEFHLSPDVSIKGDSHQLKRLFSNLLENAIKYTTSGGIVKVFLEKHKKFAVVRVEDSGVGIPQEYIPYIFQRFWRAENARSYDTNGLGLGLSIVQAIVKGHKGKIEVDSKVGVGSRFNVYLPLV